MYHAKTVKRFKAHFHSKRLTCTNIQLPGPIPGLICNSYTVENSYMPKQAAVDCNIQFPHHKFFCVNNTPYRIVTDACICMICSQK